MNKHSSPVHALVGGASVILIISVLAMAALTALTYSKARYALVISDKNARYSERIYSADAEAARILRDAEPGQKQERSIALDDEMSLFLRFDKSDDGSVNVTSHTLPVDDTAVEYENRGW